MGYHVLPSALFGAQQSAHGHQLGPGVHYICSCSCVALQSVAALAFLRGMSVPVAPYLHATLRRRGVSLTGQQKGFQRMFLLFWEMHTNIVQPNFFNGLT